MTFALTSRLRADGRPLIGLEVTRAWQLGWSAVLAVTALAAIGLGLYFRRYEGSGPHLAYVWLVTLFVWAVVLASTRRVLVSTVFVTAMVTIVVYAAAAKHAAMGMVVHAYDLVFYLTSPATISFLWASYRVELLTLIGALAGLVAALALAHAADATRVSRRISVLLAAIFAGLTWAAVIAKGERRHTQPYWSDLVVSTFYSSWPETIETLVRGQLIDAASATSEPAFLLPASCPITEKPPHIILIHEESIVPPEYFPQVSYDKGVDGMFRSGDGTLHKLRVETYGGASWLTEFSVIAGVSTYSFGGMRPFVQSLMAGKVRDTMPDALARCSYRNTVFYPLDRNFVSNAKFYAAAGMPEIFDKSDQGAKTGTEPDHVYFGNALKMIGEHVRSSSKPLFSYVITMAGHGPYRETYRPEDQVAGGGPGTHPEMHEYLRRVSMANRDLSAFKADLRKNFPNEKFLLVHYGDHQPTATRFYFGFGNVTAAEDVQLTKDSAGFLSYYAIEGINYAPPPLPTVETLDVPYLGTVILDAARLPLSPAFTERRRLISECGGRYDGCEKPGRIAVFHRRLIESGLLEAR